MSATENPKQAAGSKRVPLHLVPDTAIAEEAMAYLEGALRYGQYNWRIAGVVASTYIDAAHRHLGKFANGQNCDPKTLVHELASVRACCGILLDAIACGKLIDDRQPAAPLGAVYERLEGVMAHLKEMMKDCHATQYTEREHGVSAGSAAGVGPGD